jgi:GDP-6-deoxy-D-talose 4-dehydrogenase
MTVTLITGASGFTGRYLAPALAALGDEVHALDHSTPFTDVDGVSYSHVADLSDAAKLKSLIAEIKPDKVVHLAAIAFVAHGDIDEMYRTNVVGSRNLLHALSECGHVPNAVLLASSANIYGNTGGVISEINPPAPVNDYGVTKVAMEYVAKIYADRLPIIVTRPFNYTGRGQSPNFLLPKIVDHFHRRAPQIELGNIDVARDFSDVRIVADTYARLLSSPQAVGGVFNVCSGQATSLREILSIVENLSGHRMDVAVNPAFVRANDVKTLCGDRSHLDSVIGSLDVPSLSETLRWMLEA